MTQPTLQTPLCVDLDGTLILSDLLLETLLLLLKKNPFYIFLFPFWLLKGKAAFKAQIAKRTKLNPAALPYNKVFIDWLTEQRQTEREIWLCTASNYRLADSVADHVGIFKGVFASSDDLNLSGRAKAEILTRKFGNQGFDYCGNAKIDLAVWQASQGAIAVNCNQRLIKQASQISQLKQSFPKKNDFFKQIIKALRPHQWAKNSLIFIPLAGSHRLGELDLLQSDIIAFFAFGLCASSVYLLNDMLDLEADRQHHRKCNRPFASGRLSITAGFFLVPGLLLISANLARLLPPMFLLVLGAYYLVTVAYSFLLKKIMLIDIISLAGLYTARFLAGNAAVDIPMTFWLLLFSIFLFFSLALVKRYAELDAMQRQGKLKAAGRGYHIEDLPILHSLGVSSGYLCVLVLALYINSPAVELLYHHPQSIWLICIFLLYWISRVWLITHRGKMHDDPVVFALKDKVSLITLLLCAIAIFFAL